MVDSILLSLIFFFIFVWGGTKKGLAKVKVALGTHLAPRLMERSRLKVGWIWCCQSRVKGAINLIHSKDAMIVLMVKWVIKAIEPRQSNLPLMHPLPCLRLDYGTWRVGQYSYSGQGTLLTITGHST